MHDEPHPRRGETVTIIVGGEAHDFEIEDWWDRVSPRFEKEGGEMVYGRVVEGDRPPLSKVVYDGDLQVHHAD
jgi:hypothetical protein